MFQINEDLSIYVTRGDVVHFAVTATKDGKLHKFQQGDVLRFNVFEKKNCDSVVIRKDFNVDSEADRVEIYLSEDETKVGTIISKPTDYWYEVVLNPTSNPQTIIAYDEDGAKVFRLYPEGNDSTEITPEDISVIDNEFSVSSDKPLMNYVITRRFLENEEKLGKISQKITSKDIVPITREAFDELMAKGAWEENTIYSVLDEKDAQTVAREALEKVNEVEKELRTSKEKILSITAYRTIFAVSGEHTFNVERSGTYKITMVGAGAGGGINPSNAMVGIGGGAGAGVVKWLDLTAGDVCTVTVGEKGKGLKIDEDSVLVSSATEGGDTTLSLNAKTVLTASGGVIGFGARARSEGGDLNYSGGYPEVTRFYNSSTSPAILFLAGGNSILGNGGAFEGDEAGPGGGGYGASRLNGDKFKTGYDGGDGAVIIEYIK